MVVSAEIARLNVFSLFLPPLCLPFCPFDFFPIFWLLLAAAVATARRPPRGVGDPSSIITSVPCPQGYHFFRSSS